MRQLATIFLLCSIILQTFNTYAVQGAFLLNRDYISKTFCVNKARPAMKCNGKCYLAKQLAKQREQERQLPSAKKEQFNLLVYCQQIQSDISLATRTTQHRWVAYAERLHSSLPLGIFHPPLACSQPTLLSSFSYS